ncbi:phage tail sheath subtilisin-like domain-containing protein [bacterium]|nr:phage tail sheath subtilisin-like domain-containing protein [bacterium]
MPVTPTYPGVYIEEVPSGVRTITGVATSITAFIGRALLGPVNKAVTINSFGDFERNFGGLWLESSLGYAVRDFYLNGGSQAVIVRLFADVGRKKAEDAAKAVAEATTGDDAGKAAEAAREEADKYKNDPEKSAADKVAKAAEAAAKADGATVDSVKAAAEAAVATAVPYAKAKLSIGDLKLEAAYEGAWGANLRARIDLENITDPYLINLTITNADAGGAIERFLNLSVAKDSSRRIDRVMKEESRLARWDGEWPDVPPDIGKIRLVAKELEDELKKSPASATDVIKKQDAHWKLTQDSVTLAQSKYLRAKKAREQKQNEGATAEAIKTAKEAEDKAKKAWDDAQKVTADGVSDGFALTINDFLPPNGETEKKGMYTLEQADLFNLLCIPPYKGSDVDVNLVSAAASYCEKRRAMLLVDSPSTWTDKSKAKEEFTATDDKVGTKSKNAALFFPRLRQPNSLRDNQMEDFAPCGVIAGVMARTDVQRGVWKAPAGLDATLVGVPQLSVSLTDAENGELNPLGINCLRAFPVSGRVVWGSRTLRGADQLADEYKYIPVRRLALYIEESLYRGTQWVVYEPNDEPLWSQIRLNIGAFMHNLFRQGAFQGSTPREAYFVKCDKETTTQNDINLGIVNIHVGFAPLKPAEFVIIKLQQMAGQIQT